MSGLYYDPAIVTIKNSKPELTKAPALSTNNSNDRFPTANKKDSRYNKGNREHGNHQQRVNHNHSYDLPAAVQPQRFYGDQGPKQHPPFYCHEIEGASQSRRVHAQNLQEHLHQILFDPRYTNEEKKCYQTDFDFEKSNAMLVSELENLDQMIADVKLSGMAS